MSIFSAPVTFVQQHPLAVAGGAVVVVLGYIFLSSGSGGSAESDGGSGGMLVPQPSDASIAAGYQAQALALQTRAQLEAAQLAQSAKLAEIGAAQTIEELRLQNERLATEQQTSLTKYQIQKETESTIRLSELEASIAEKQLETQLAAQQSYYDSQRLIAEQAQETTRYTAQLAANVNLANIAAYRDTQLASTEAWRQTQLASTDAWKQTQLAATHAQLQSDLANYATQWHYYDVAGGVAVQQAYYSYKSTKEANKNQWSIWNMF